MKDDPEFIALAAVYTALKDLNAESQTRVIEYVCHKLGVASPTNREVRSSGSDTSHDSGFSPVNSNSPHTAEHDNDTDGISPIAIKWMRRSSLTANELSQFFSLGTEEIDLVAKKIPGKSKNARTKSVVLLKGIAAYLSTGAARMTDEQIKEACIHYDAFDSPNHAKYLKRMAAEVSGSKANGFVLTARGITSATEILNELLGKKAAQ